MKLRQAKNELERKVQDQEEELDEQAGTIQQLEQVGSDLSRTLCCCFVSVLMSCTVVCSWGYHGLGLQTDFNLSLL